MCCGFRCDGEATECVDGAVWFGVVTEMEEFGVVLRPARGTVGCFTGVCAHGLTGLSAA